VRKKQGGGKLGGNIKEKKGNKKEGQERWLRKKELNGKKT
jgi:hypothetical protein